MPNAISYALSLNLFCIPRISSQQWSRLSVRQQAITWASVDKHIVAETKWPPFCSAFSWMKIYEFWLKFHWSLFLVVQLTISQHWLGLWLGADQATSHYLKQWWLVYWRIYASLGLNELIKMYIIIGRNQLTHWGRVIHMCISRLTIIG